VSLKCPACGSMELTDQEITDHFLSKKKFIVSFCNDCGHGATNFPENNDTSSYYNSKEYYSHTDQGGGLLIQLYKVSRLLMLRYKHKIISRYKKNPGSLLDYGCGTGAFLTYMKGRGWTIMGLEPNHEARKEAEKKTGIPITKSAEEIRGRYDLVTLWHVLEHTKNPTLELKRLNELAPRNGLLIVAVPNYKSYDADHYKKYWAGYDVPRHLHHFTKKSLINVAEKSGWKYEGGHPMKLDSYYVSLLSEKYIKGQTDLLSYLRAFITGGVSNIMARRTKNYSSNIFIFQKC